MWTGGGGCIRGGDPVVLGDPVAMLPLQLDCGVCNGSWDVQLLSGPSADAGTFGPPRVADCCLGLMQGFTVRGLPARV